MAGLGSHVHRWNRHLREQIFSPMAHQCSGGTIQCNNRMQANHCNPLAADMSKCETQRTNLGTLPTMAVACGPLKVK